MKNWIAWTPCAGLALLIIAWSNRGAPQTAASALTTSLTAAAALAYAEVPAAGEAAAIEPPPLTAPATNAAPTNITEAAAAPVAAETPAPPNVRTTGPAAELIKLASSGQEEAVLLAFVTNFPDLFNLTAEEIIYLKDLGLSSNVVTAILQHDQALKEAATAPAPNPMPGEAQYAPPTPSPLPVMPQPVPVAPPPVPADADYPPPDSYAPAPAAAIEDTFYDALAPYGTWMNVEGYGLCWRPSVVVVNPGWQPYFDGGSWLYSDCGWYWLSDYSWGWAPFHYGRWFRHHHWGWCWLPDLLWAPSWVCWRHTEGYCGWAPLPPGAWYRPGVGLCYQGRPVGLNFSFNLGLDSFAFVAWGHFQDRHPAPFGLRGERAGRIFHESTVASRFVGSGRIVSNYGLSAEHVAAVTHTPVPMVAIRETAAPPGSGLRAERLARDGRTLALSRPRVIELASRTTTARSHGGLASAPAKNVLSPGLGQPGYAASRNLGAPRSNLEQDYNSPGRTAQRLTPATSRAAPSRTVEPATGAGRPQAAMRTGAGSPSAYPDGLSHPVPSTPAPSLTGRESYRPVYPPSARGDQSPRPGYTLPAARESRVPAYQPAAEVPRYPVASAAERGPAPAYSPPRSYTAPAPAPAARSYAPPAYAPAPAPAPAPSGGGHASSPGGR